MESLKSKLCLKTVAYFLASKIFFEIQKILCECQYFVEVVNCGVFKSFWIEADNVWHIVRREYNILSNLIILHSTFCVILHILLYTSERNYLLS